MSQSSSNNFSLGMTSSNNGVTRPCCSFNARRCSISRPSGLYKAPRLSDIATILAPLSCKILAIKLPALPKP